MQKLPPYGKNLFQLQQQGLKPNYTIFIWIGNNAWSMARHTIDIRPDRTLLIPPWECPTGFMWPVNGCRVLIVDTGWAEDAYLNDLTYCLYQGGAGIVFCNTPDSDLIIFHKE